MSLSEQIWKIREFKGMQEKELAVLLGIAITTVSKYENGRMENPSFETMNKLRKIFEVSSEYFYSDDTPMFQYALEQDSKMLRQFVCLPEEPFKDAIRKLVESEYWNHKKIQEETAFKNRFKKPELRNLGVAEDILKSIRK